MQLAPIIATASALSSSPGIWAGFVLAVLIITGVFRCARMILCHFEVRMILREGPSGTEVIYEKQHRRGTTRHTVNVGHRHEPAPAIPRTEPLALPPARKTPPREHTT